VKPGDLVIRRIRGIPDWKQEAAINQRNLLGHGLVLSNHITGNPKHKCVTVFYPQAGKAYDIAESLLEVVSESR
jgi:hypothetical protein